jgi:hypothetical protein
MPNAEMSVSYVFETVPRIYVKFGIGVLDRLCGLVVRVPGYRSRGLGFGSRRYQIF